MVAIVLACLQLLGVMHKKYTLDVLFGACLYAVFFSPSIYAEDMPEITEPPAMERETPLRDADIPAVRDRPIDPSAGPRLDVRKFWVQLVEYPELGILKEEIIARVEAIRFDLMSENERLASGYTLEELDELGELIADIEQETQGDKLGTGEVERLVFLVRKQRRKRGMTLSMIEQVADAITRYYREKGLILAKAYIPKQTVRDGIVKLTVLPGILGEINVINNNDYTEERLWSVFNKMMLQPVTGRQIEERLLLLNDYPGLSVQGFFEPGSAVVGETKLTVNVVNEDSFESNVRLDNHGADETGENRLYTDIIWNNMTGHGDRLYLAALRADDPGDTTYWALNYRFYPFNPRFFFTVGAANNDFTIGRGNAERALGFDDVTGESKVWDASVTWVLQRSLASNSSLDFTFENIESDIESTSSGFTNVATDLVNNSVLGYNYEVLNDSPRRLHSGRFAITASDFKEGAQGLQEEKSLIYSFEYTGLSFWKIPFSDAESRLIMRASGQYSGDALASVNQVGLGGPTRARGFAVDEFYADDMLYAGIDWVFPAPGFLQFAWNNSQSEAMIQPFLFMDTAYGESNPLTEGDDVIDVTFTGTGIGFKFSVSESIRSNLQVGFPVDQLSAVGRELEDDGAKVYFDFEYRF